jgi:hypothetical protein
VSLYFSLIDTFTHISSLESCLFLAWSFCSKLCRCQFQCVRTAMEVFRH